jgi:hypothetical protein
MVILLLFLTVPKNVVKKQMQNKYTTYLCIISYISGCTFIQQILTDIIEGTVEMFQPMIKNWSTDISII